MTNKYYEPGDQRAARVNDLFAKIASRYDLINDLQSLGLHRRWKQRVARMAGGATGQRALDLCCGTGDLAFALARDGMQVAGLDFSEPMLGVARARMAETCGGDGAVTFLRGDAQAIPFPDNTFDAVTIGYGLRNLASWEAGLREMHRVARAGGRLVVLEFGKPDNALWRATYFGYLKLFVPVLGKLFCGDAATHSYILESLKHYPAQNGVAAKMREMGMGSVRIVSLMGGAMSINYGEKAGD